MTQSTLAPLLARLAKARAALAKKPGLSAAHQLAAVADAMGYYGERELKAARIAHGKLIGEAVRHYEALIARGEGDAAAVNNIGVFHCNAGRPREARRWFARAARLDPLDAGIHENLFIADVLMHKSERQWHSGPKGLKRGRRTLVAYFDAHGM